MAVIMTPIEELARDFTRFVTETNQETLVVQQVIGLQMLTGCVLKTPVDEGRARGNWQVSFGSPKEGIVSVPDKPNESGDPANGTAPGQNAITKGASAFTSQKVPFGVFWIVNNLPYILVLDQGGFVPKDPGPSKDRRKFRKGKVLVKGGFSVQAPNGMVDRTIEEIRTQFN